MTKPIGAIVDVMPGAEVVVTAVGVLVGITTMIVPETVPEGWIVSVV